jgi:fructose-1,6-bisphosphatase II
MGTTQQSKGAPNSISCIAAASPEEGSRPLCATIPSFYMTKLAYGPRVLQHMQISGIDTIKIESPIEETLHAVAQASEQTCSDVVVTML